AATGDRSDADAGRRERRPRRARRRSRRLSARRRLSAPTLCPAVSDLQALQARLQYQFKDEGLLRLALTHPSLAHEQGASSAHNQRLEFLGDAVLGLAITSELYLRF